MNGPPQGTTATAPMVTIPGTADMAADMGTTVAGTTQDLAATIAVTDTTLTGTAGSAGRGAGWAAGSKLFDRLDLWVHPVVLGVGKKVFDDGAVPTNVTLLEPPVASPKGTVYLRYGLADGTPETGDMSAPDRRAGEA
jgi:hypothetical protein